MRILGYDINVSKAAKKTGSGKGGWELRPNDGQGPYTTYFSNYIARKIEPSFYEFLREAIPIIDAAIKRLVVLDGHIEVVGDNDALVEEIKEWIYNVPVNDIQKGLQAYHQNWTNETFEQGFGLGEFVTDKKRTDIVGLRVADSKFIKFKRTDFGLALYQRADNDSDWRLLNVDNLQYFSIDNENQNPYGTPLMRSCEFTAKILATMHNSLLHVWERFGDPSFSVIYKTSRSDGTDHEQRRKTIQEEFNTAIRAKREGKSADFVRAIDKNSEITIDVIGAGGQVLELEVPVRHVVEQIVAKTGLPPWTLGLSWSTTERLADNQAEILLADINTRQAAKMPHFYNLVRTLLLLRGRTWKKGDWKLQWAQVNLRDALKQAQARFMNAQADMYDRENGLPVGETTTGKALYNVRGPAANRHKSIPCAHEKNSGDLCGEKTETQRPKVWPELDTIEDEYTERLQSDWSDLKERIFVILKLGQISGQHMAKDEIPAADIFTFTDEQRASIMQSMRNSIDGYSIDDPDSPVSWYYAQSYSLGLIQAARLIGKNRPILDIIKNKEIYDELCASGFTLVKDNTTKTITRKIIPEMEAQMIAGTNPRHVAARLKKLFDDKNSDWERLARSEMTMAAEKAKTKEWAAWGVAKEGFGPAPDACPACQSLAGEYEIGKCPTPVADTHPRCRCAKYPVD